MRGDNRRVGRLSRGLTGARAGCPWATRRRGRVVAAAVAGLVVVGFVVAGEAAAGPAAPPITQPSPAAPYVPPARPAWTPPAPVARAVSLKVSAASVTVGGKVTFSGSLSRSPAGSAVWVQRLSGRTWVTVAKTKTTNAAGAFKVVWADKVAGHVAFRAHAPGTASLAAAASAKKYVDGYRTAKAVLTSKSLTLAAGTNTMTVKGKAAPFKAGAKVSLQRLNGSKWVTIGTTTMSKSGTFARATSNVANGTSAKFRFVVAQVKYVRQAVTATMTVAVNGRATATSVGSFYQCAIVLGGSVRCVGDNRMGSLGNGTTADSYTPVTVTGVTNATAISAGSWHACALLSDETVKCWGSNMYGDLGNGTTIDSSKPVAVIGITDATAVTVGWSHACALVSGGVVKCWGANYLGQLGDGTETDSSTPVTVSGIAGATAITAGDDSTCALLADGAVSCWGSIGGTWWTAPVAVAGITGATAISAGSEFACAVLSGGSVMCWGLGGNGELGNGATDDSDTPVTVTGVTGATVITSGSSHTCVVLAGGAVKCWGGNDEGELGNGTTVGASKPVSVTGITTAISVATGDFTTCALVRGGIIKCWGEFVGSPAPVTVAGF